MEIMEYNMIKQAEQKEFAEIDAILPLLLKEGLITDIECRIITSCNKIMEKKGAVYTVMMSKTKEEAGNLTEIFRNLTMSIHAKENSSGLPDNNSNDEQNYVLPSQNPLMNNIIIKHLFGFLTLQDMKRFRLVCREWNSTAEICLRKKSAINLRPKVLLPQTFMEIAKYSQPDLPFPSFVFSNYKNLEWNISDIQDFLEKGGKFIKEVSFNDIKLVRICSETNKKKLIRNYEISPLFINPSNVTSLKINRECDHERKQSFDICLEKFVSIKTLSLNYCRIIVPPKDQITRVAPHSVHFNRVSFIRKGKVVKHFHYNDLLDFSKIVNVHLAEDYNYIHNDGILDMGEPVFNMNRLSIESIRVINWSQAKGNVEFLRLRNTDFEEKNQLKIKLMSFIWSTIDLTALPETLEVLQFDERSQLNCNAPLNLPNLKYMGIDAKNSASMQNSLAYFSNCENLIELEIRKGTHIIQPRIYKFNLSCIPKSVKKIQMQLLEITFSDDSILELDTLILECSNGLLGLRDCTAITSQIKAKMIIVDFGKEWDIETVEFGGLVANKQIKELTIISSNLGLLNETPFEESDLSKYVYKDSISRYGNQEFEKYKIKDYFQPYFL